jgi:hypothetical protein
MAMRTEFEKSDGYSATVNTHTTHENIQMSCLLPARQKNMYS